MAQFDSYLKTLTQLQRLGRTIPRCLAAERPFEVDIELMVERRGIRIDAVPLKAERGIEAWISISSRVLYVDIGLADSDWLERRYRFTIAEEFAHSILHAGIFRAAHDVSDWLRIWKSLPPENYFMLDRQAKELAGILLMTEDTFLPRAIQLRNDFLSIQGNQSDPDSESQSRILTQILQALISDFNVNQVPCRIRLERLTKFTGGLFRTQ